MPYDAELPRPVTAEAFERLERCAHRKPRIALAGEFSAGKSTLLNFLLGGNVLPVQATATAAPPVWLSEGNEPSFAIMGDGTRREVDNSELGKLGADCRIARVFVDADILKTCDVIDLPGISDPNRSDEAVRNALLNADLVIWCTPSTQAWRQSERSTWMSLPDRVAQNAILAVTRSDKLGSAHDRDRVRRRLERETEGMFSGIMMISVTQASAAIRDDDDDKLTDSGMVALYGMLSDRIDEIRTKRQDMLERYSVLATPELSRVTAEARPQLTEDPDTDDEAETADLAFSPDTAFDAGANHVHDVAGIEELVSAAEEGAAETAEYSTDNETDPSELFDGIEQDTQAEDRAADEETPELQDEAADDSDGVASAIANVMFAAADLDAPDAETFENEAVEDFEADALEAPALFDEDDDEDLEDDEIDALEAAQNLELPAQTSTEVVPAQARIWREIVAEFGDDDVNPKLVAMIDQLLLRAFAPAAIQGDGTE